jgi:hypothetical protein
VRRCEPREVGVSHAAHAPWALVRSWIYIVEGTDAPPPHPVDPDRLRQRDTGKPLGTFLFGTPEDFATAIVEATAGTPVETAFFFASMGACPTTSTSATGRPSARALAPARRRVMPGVAPS